MPVVFDPKYILRLDDLPKIVESDGTVYPVFMTLRDAARLFQTEPTLLVRWGNEYGLPLLRVGGKGGRIYIEIAKFNDWIAEHSTPRRQPREREIWADDVRPQPEER